MDAALVSEGTGANVCLIAPQRQVCEFGDEAGHVGELFQIFLADGRVTELQFEVGQDGADIGVAATFAIAVDAALDVSDTRFHGDERVGYGEFRIIVGVNSQDAIKAGAHFGDNFREAGGHSAAIGIAHAEHVGAGLLRGFESFERVFGVGMIAVEKMFSVIHDFAAVRFQIADSVGDQLQVFFEADAERALDMEIPGFAEDGDGRRVGGDQFGDAGVLFYADSWPDRVEPNAVSLACLSFRLRARSKNSLSFGLEPGQPPSM